MRNVSIAVGREASIDCHVSDADDYKVSFVNAMKILERYRMLSLIYANGFTEFTNLSWYRTWQHYKLYMGNIYLVTVFFFP